MSLLDIKVCEFSVIKKTFPISGERWNYSGSRLVKSKNCGIIQK